MASQSHERKQPGTPQRRLRVRQLVSAAVVAAVGLAVLGLLGSLFSGLRPSGTTQSEGPDLTARTVQKTVEILQDAESQLVLVTQLGEAVEAAQTEVAQAPPEVIATLPGEALIAAVEEAMNVSSAPVSLATLESVAQELEAARNDFADQQSAYYRLLQDFEDSDEYGRAAVVVLETQSGRPLVVWNGDQVFTAASTAKLFVAASMISAVQSGEVTWNSSLAGNSLGNCFDQMMVYSDNDCPEAWFLRKGPQEVEDHARAHGAINTTLHWGDLRTTAMDLANVLVSFDGGSEMSADNKTKLLDAMGNQIFRDGIPAGLGADVVVQDKVGFLDGYLHDAALIRSPKGDYAMVVLTENMSWEQIADLSALAYDYLPDPDWRG